MSPKELFLGEHNSRTSNSLKESMKLLVTNISVCALYTRYVSHNNLCWFQKFVENLSHYAQQVASRKIKKKVLIFLFLIEILNKKIPNECVYVFVYACVYIFL